MSNNRKVRVRFAPSPTGPLHMGGMRTALYNYFFAKQHGGDFILRIEDTDSNRFVPGAEEYIIRSLAWCGITPDEGIDENGKVVEEKSDRHPHAPYRQSQRKPLYRQYAEELVAKGFAYYAFDTPEEIDAVRKECESRGETFIYGHANRLSFKTSLTMDEAECKRRIEEEKHWTIRFKNPEDRIVKMKDLIRGEIEINTATLDDKVLWKAADQLPTYHLANIVDDHLMEVSHVIRGEEWLPSLPLHYMLYEAFGWQDTQPEFAHLSLLLKPDGKGKLSKRDGDRLGFPVFPLEWTSATGEVSRGYREDGYYPEAFVNLIALLGWNPGTEQEIFSLEEFVKCFSLDRVVKSGARFNPDKAKWFNQEYLRKRSNNELAQEFLPILAKNGIENIDVALVEKIIASVKDRAHFVSDFWELTNFFFVRPTEYDATSVKKFWKEEIIPSVKEISDMIVTIAPFEKEVIEERIHTFITDGGLPMGKIMNALRLAIVGASKGPGVADIIALIGAEEFRTRIDNALSTISR